MNHKVFITGGSGEIGKKVVEIFKSSGYDVYHPSRVDLDLSKDFNLIDTDFDIIINNAGVNPLKSITNVDDLEVFQVNYLSPLKIIQKVIPHMIKNNFGRIVNVGSIWIENSKYNRSAYSASKSALHSLSKSLTSEYAKYNILSNTVSPGFVATRMTYKNNTEQEINKIVENIPVGRMANSSEVADLIFYLTTKNNYITGQNIIIDGGFSCVRN